MLGFLRRLIADRWGVTALECGMITAVVMVIAIVGLSSYFPPR